MSDASGEVDPLVEQQRRLAELDPGFADVDITDPAARAGLEVVAAIFLGGSDVTIVAVDDGGREESLTFSQMGDNVDGNPLVQIGIRSSDGQLSPASAEAVAIVLTHGIDIDQGVQHLLDEGPKDEET